MIDHVSDHAANERTSLAWVRTAIAVMAFGFLGTKFNLFLKVAAQSLAGSSGHSIPVPGGGFGDLAGLILIVAGTAMVAMAAVRFVRTAQAINSPSDVPAAHAWTSHSLRSWWSWGLRLPYTSPTLSLHPCDHRACGKRVDSHTEMPECPPASLHPTCLYAVMTRRPAQYLRRQVGKPGRELHSTQVPQRQLRGIPSNGL